ncbi:hypothetical protein VaNZ11_014106 [Volvox africanus]|uniref:Uncharacterized protein n=1 Tax=Volvox africanus TaxID=51714 RepID=A0ABQ5SI51_9CHLO|nr:hypothetical protein VaNZ11_014106 [Volvox africanus]
MSGAVRSFAAQQEKRRRQYSSMLCSRVVAPRHVQSGNTGNSMTRFLKETLLKLTHKRARLSKAQPQASLPLWPPQRDAQLLCYSVCTPQPYSRRDAVSMGMQSPGQYCAYAHAAG